MDAHHLQMAVAGLERIVQKNAVLNWELVEEVVEEVLGHCKEHYSIYNS